MHPLTYIHASEAARCQTCGGGIVGNAIPADAPIPEQSSPTEAFPVAFPSVAMPGLSRA